MTAELALLLDRLRVSRAIVSGVLATPGTSGFISVMRLSVGDADTLLAAFAEMALPEPSAGLPDCFASTPALELRWANGSRTPVCPVHFSAATGFIRCDTVAESIHYAVEHAAVQTIARIKASTPLDKPDDYDGSGRERGDDSRLAEHHGD